VKQKRITLAEWGQREFGDGIDILTLRRWARGDKIFPKPEKIGRTYFVTENARYVTDYNDPTFLEAVRGSTAAQ
jgi:predicted site-specific integrase-resolvase